MEGGVVCRQLKFTGANAVMSRWYHYGYRAGSGPVLLGNIKCTGNEIYIWECIHRGWNAYHPNCDTHRYDVGVDCY